MRLDPGIGVALDVGRLTLALAHQMVLRADVGHRQLHQLKQLGGGGLLAHPHLVAHDVLVVDGEAVVLAVGHARVGAGLHAGHGRARHLQPHRVHAGAQHVAQPVGRPGVEQHGLALLEARQRVRDQRRVVALHVAHGVAQLEGGQLVLDHGLAAPAGVGAQQVGLAIAIGVEQARQLWFGQLADVRDLVLVGRALVDHVALRGAGGEHTLA